METTLTIGQEEINLKANAITAFHYKNQFKSDILKDSLHAVGGIESILKMEEIDREDVVTQTIEMLDRIDTTLIYQLIWAFARTADSKFPPFMRWLNEVEFIPATELMVQEGFIELLTGNIQRKK